MSVLSDVDLLRTYSANDQLHLAGLLAVAEAAIAADRAARAEPVAVHQFRKAHCADWYDGLPDHEDGRGPYEERTLYTAPPAAPVVPDGWKLEIVDDDRGVGVRVTRPDGCRHCFWRDGWKGEQNPSEQAAYDLCRAMLAAARAPSCSQSVEKSTGAGAHVVESEKIEHVEPVAPVCRATSKPMALPVNRFDTASNRPKRPGPWSEKPFKR